MTHRPWAIELTGFGAMANLARVQQAANSFARRSTGPTGEN